MNRTVKHQITGEQITFLETAEETLGKYLYIEVALPPQGDGPPLHSHDEFEEEFEVVSGQLTVTLGKEQYVLFQLFYLLFYLQQILMWELQKQMM